MSKFCMYCGRELEDDEVCNCREKVAARSKFSSSDHIEPSTEDNETTEPESKSSAPESENSTESFENPVNYTQSTYQNPNSYGQAPFHEGPTYVYHPPIPKDSAVSRWFYRIGQYLKNFFTAPADTISKAANEKDYPVAIFFLVIRAILASSFVMAILRGVVMALNHTTTSLTGTRYFTLNSLLQSFGLNAVGAFFFMVIGMLVCNLIFCVLAFAIAKIFRSKTSFAAVLGAFGVSSIGVTVGFILAASISLTIPALALPVMVGYVVLNFSFTYIALIKSFKLSGNKMTYLFALLAVVYTILCMVFFTITPLSTGLSNLPALFSNFSLGSGSGISSGSGFNGFF